MAAGFFDRIGLAERRFSSDRRQVSREAAWKARRARIPRAKPSKGLVRVDPALQKTILQFLDQVAPATSRAFNRHLVPMAERQFQAWPILSGFSRSVLGLSFRPVGGGSAFVGELVDDAPYAGFIERGAVARRLFAAGELAADKMADELARTVGQ